ncbi:hypothetical protein AUEXF2481DRAFT_540919 [Aureobasidium subglaciale EXF-2481]|uniref:Uncharacterized protein n=1 Tax=Aureobasidium subglaciale (strain EXF-2481) TaxID=1043005 RepID=A0A074YIU3_AURSE|nr:uncharacterized protein AUEXF2481DRAFT_540919 [Aureobasidium subglaciale EXF-2481]KEQ97698.1 hypothetical protein AUEXF2481DRAFT_540919 [Aureobasidium subglaciale EXF-2481]
MKSSKAELEKASLKANELALERTKVKEKLETVQKAKKAVEEARDRADSTGKMAAARLRLILIDEDVNEAEFEQFLDLLVEMSSNTALASIEFPMGEEAFEGLSPLQESVQWAISFCSLEQTTPYLHQSLDLHVLSRKPETTEPTVVRHARGALCQSRRARCPQAVRSTELLTDCLLDSL